MGIGKQKTVHEVDYKDLNRLIRDTYGHEFEVVADQEWGNDESHSVTFRRKVELDAYDRKKVEEFRGTGRGDFVLYPLMQDMVNNGVLDEGDYVILVSW